MLAIRERVLGRDHSETLTSVNNLSLSVEIRDRDEATDLARRAVQGAIKTLGPEHPRTQKYQQRVQRLEERAAGLIRLSK